MSRCRAATVTVASPPPETAGATRLIGEAPAPKLSNWNKSYFFTPAKYVEPTTIDEIQAVRLTRGDDPMLNRNGDTTTVASTIPEDICERQLALARLAQLVSGHYEPC